MSEIKLCEMNKKQLISKCKELNITKISNKNKKQIIELIVQKLQNIDVNKVITYAEESSIDYNKYANIIIRTFEKYMNMQMKGYAGGNLGLGKWLIIIDDNNTPNPELTWLGNIIGVTDYKLFKGGDKISKYYPASQTCLCIYCGVNEKILTPEKQHNWILHIGKKLSKSPYLKQISMRSKIWFKENIKTREGIYSFNNTNVCNLSVNI